MQRAAAGGSLATKTHTQEAAVACCRVDRPAGGPAWDMNICSRRLQPTLAHGLEIRQLALLGPRPASFDGAQLPGCAGGCVELELELKGYTYFKYGIQR